jgi:hypothetical protein
MLKFHFFTAPDYIVTTVAIDAPLFFTAVTKLVVSGVETHKQNHCQ